jgi:bifunctional DNA-binding transcriptional regulator/antitoxin component of YhaV-PrlF toxin-antitoxin module
MARVKKLILITRNVLYNSQYIKYNMGDTTTLVKTRKVGGSLIVTLPKEIVESKKIREGEIVEITVKKIRVDGFGALRGISPFTVEDELKIHE